MFPEQFTGDRRLTHNVLYKVWPDHLHLFSWKHDQSLKLKGGGWYAFLAGEVLLIVSDWVLVVFVLQPLLDIGLYIFKLTSAIGAQVRASFFNGLSNQWKLLFVLTKVSLNVSSFTLWRTENPVGVHIPSSDLTLIIYKWGDVQPLKEHLMWTVQNLWE